MPNYTNFDQVLNDKKLSLPAKDAFARRWLERTYGIDYDINTAFFDELTRVHDHDQQPLHLGRVLLQNAAGAIFVHLIKDPASRKWRLALIFPENQEEALILDPEDDAEDGALTQFKNMLAAPPAAPQTRAVDPSRPYADLEAYSNGSLTDEDSRAQHRGSYDPASIPGFLFDPAYVPGIPGAQTTDPTIGVSLEDALRRLGHAV